MQRGIWADEPAWEEEPAAEPAAAGVPPRRPPTAVGMDDAHEDDDPEPVPQWGDAQGVDVPLAETSLPPRVVRALRRGGYRTVWDTKNLSDTRLERLGLDVAERHAFRRWRYGWMDEGRV